MPYKLVYITAGNLADAKNIGRELVEKRLAACVNIIDNMKSIYYWEGKLCEENEVVILAKTTESRVDALIDRVKKIHPYKCPCIVVVPIEKGNDDFLKWIRESTNPDIS